MEKFEKVIYVTQPSLPPLNEFVEYLEQIWESKRVTNQGSFHRQLEDELAQFLGVKHVTLFANGTLALISAMQALRITGEVITTPYSFVATTHSLYWNNIKPVFADIDPIYCNLSPDAIEAAITPSTTAILPVHVYGNPCDAKRIQEIADIYGLKIIYDACHAFGVRCNDESVLNFGDMSVLSFHGTKIFNTMEGGAVICHDEKTKKRLDFLKNFGFADEITVVQPGINAKMNEMQAALGLLQLKNIDSNIADRQKIVNQYRENLKGVDGLRFLEDMLNVKHNYAYFPVFINEKEYGKTRDELYETLKLNGIFSRRYFYPLISHFPIYKGDASANPLNLPIAEKLTREVICLPLYPNLKEGNAINKICEIMIS